MIKKLFGWTLYGIGWTALFVGVALYVSVAAVMRLFGVQVRMLGTK